SYLANELYLNKVSCEYIENILHEFKTANFEYFSIRFYQNSGVTDGETLKKAFAESRQASRKIKDEFPKALKELKENFTAELEKFEITRE
ncbi:MAG TPA: hypothetical protein VFJ43_03790, partial [Bacteroidia bacterium]|nr:hypothetical protein [Bacteroidia bacterium]